MQRVLMLLMVVGIQLSSFKAVEAQVINRGLRFVSFPSHRLNVNFFRTSFGLPCAQRWIPFGGVYWNSPIISNWGLNYYQPRYFQRSPIVSEAYAAISYSKKEDTVGLSWQYRSRYTAENTANNYCGATDCQTVVWVRSGCASLAMSDSVKKEGLSISYAPSKSRAISDALSYCRASGAESCETRGWVCSGN